MLQYHILENHKTLQKIITHCKTYLVDYQMDQVETPLLIPVVQLQKKFRFFFYLKKIIIYTKGAERAVAENVRPLALVFY